MELVTPGIGLFFWMLLSFSLVLFVLKKFAWKPILNALKDREESIDDAIKTAEKTREEMEKLKADNELIMKEARAEKEQILKEAREIKETIIEQARKDASSEAGILLEKARIQIRHEKTSAIDDMKEQVTTLSVQIAEKILKEKLTLDKEQQKIIGKYLNEASFN
jgi:F-type H+-transporting ATPase subunit b